MKLAQGNEILEEIGVKGKLLELYDNFQPFFVEVNR